jgi:5-methylcytosine-specific restriction enzyme subunit McrC
VENRLIKTTLQYLYKRSHSSRNQQRIREFLFVFDEVGVSRNVKTDFDAVKSDRQMRHYEQVILWCQTFLQHQSFTPYKGDTVAFALLFDMNKLFESYVFDYLRRKGGFESIKAQDGTHYLAYKDQKGIFRLKPDIVIRDDKGKTVIIDTKWKLLSEDKSHKGVLQADMYQMFAYGTKYKNCESIYLIYPRDMVESGEGYSFYKKCRENQNGCEKELNVNVLFFDVCQKDKKNDDENEEAIVSWNDKKVYEIIKESLNAFQ